MFFKQTIGIDATDSQDMIRYKRITHLLTVLGSLIFSLFLPFCFLSSHPAVRIVGFLVLATILACLMGVWLTSRRQFLGAKNLVSASVLLLYSCTPFLMGTDFLDGTLLFVFPATLFFAYRPQERMHAVFLVVTALCGYFMVLCFASPAPLLGGSILTVSPFWIDSASKLILFLFIAVICYFAAQEISSHEIALAKSLNQSDTLLLNILPKPIADRLKNSSQAIADRHEQVAVLFADIANFTPLSERISPDALVALLNDIFHTFDHIAQRHGVEKIKTIGDAYMAAAGVPQEGSGDIQAIADCALEMAASAKNLTDPLGNLIQLRIGIHCGPAVAGVIGAHKFAYDLWGDTVNTASRMESHGEAGRIHVSAEMQALLKDAYDFEARGEVEIKGKGKLRTWWLVGRAKLKPVFLIATLLMFVSSFMSVEAAQHPADRYADAYKRYVDAPFPIPLDAIKHFVYFARDREAMRTSPFLTNSRFVGAQIMYPWALLEPQKDVYDFSMIAEDYAYLKSQGKKLFVQLQDATFDPTLNAVPAYLRTTEYDGGALSQRDDSGQPEGWVAKRWNPKVRERFSKLLAALGREFDGKIEGINLQETSIGVSSQADPSFSEAMYAEAVKANMLAMKTAFRKSVTMQYANFMPGEWLPSEDKGYLRSIYHYGEQIGVGLGGPDLMFTKRGQLNHLIALMHENRFSVPLGIAVQDGNYIGETNTDRVVHHRENMVPVLHAFAKDFMRVNYMFWVNQEPYFTQDVLPSFPTMK